METLRSLLPGGVTKERLEDTNQFTRDYMYIPHSASQADTHQVNTNVYIKFIELTAKWCSLYTLSATWQVRYALQGSKTILGCAVAKYSITYSLKMACEMTVHTDAINTTEVITTSSYLNF